MPPAKRRLVAHPLLYSGGSGGNKTLSREGWKGSVVNKADGLAEMRTWIQISESMPKNAAHDYNAALGRPTDESLGSLATQCGESPGHEKPCLSNEADSTRDTTFRLSSSLCTQIHSSLTLPHTRLNRAEAQLSAIT